MSIVKWKWLCIALFTIVVIESGCLWLLSWRETYALWDVQTARIAVTRIQNNRRTAADGTVEDAVSALRDLLTCYKDWPWQRSDLLLRDFVEKQRADAIQESIESLRRKTGNDVGDAPEEWIKKFGGAGNGARSGPVGLRN